MKIKKYLGTKIVLNQVEYYLNPSMNHSFWIFVQVYSCAENFLSIEKEVTSLIIHRILAAAFIQMPFLFISL